MVFSDLVTVSLHIMKQKLLECFFSFPTLFLTSIRAVGRQRGITDSKDHDAVESGPLCSF